MKSSSTKGWMFWVWLGVITSPILIECSQGTEPIPHRECGYIGPMRAKGTHLETKPTVTPSWEKPEVTSYSHKKHYHTSSKSGVILKRGNKRIETGMTSEEIINQLSLDYQDLYDYYGGAEEIF